MKIAITGATGGLGRNLLEHLIGEGHTITALGRDAVIGNALVACGARFLRGDMSDLNYLTMAFAEQDAIVHSAALAAPWGAWRDFYTANVVGTENVLQAARAAKVQKIIHLSTPSIYFSGLPAESVREDAQLPASRTHYARSKIMAEERVVAFARETGVSTIIIRPRAIFGRYDRAILPRILRVMEKGRFPLPSGGVARVDVTAVENVVHAIQLGLQSTHQWRGEAFNITNGEPMRVLDLMHALVEEFNLNVKFFTIPSQLLHGIAAVFETMSLMTKREPLLTRYSAQLLSITQTLNIDRARHELGYSPIINVRTALHCYAKWITEQQCV